ncbi:YfbM family protein [Dactylosporangium cerinum]|uniref:YfbM family protein n=1 Tax=Dactylosporangium cerinum TaxID=1434730 RepID=A0ABV9WA18_9ACTN
MELIGRWLTAAELREVLDDPDAVEVLLFGDDGDEDDDEVGEMPEPDLDLGKSWHVVQFLFTGTAWGVTEGLGEAILGGADIGEDGGYGPARLLDAATVTRVATALDALDVETLRSRFDPAAMSAAEIYPEGWDFSPADFEEIVRPLIGDLRAFYRKAAARGQAVLLAIA